MKKTMTILEQEIWVAVIQEGENRMESGTIYTEVDRAEVAAEVAKKYIKEAFEAGANAVIHEINTVGMVSYNAAKDRWLKENGITE